MISYVKRISQQILISKSSHILFPTINKFYKPFNHAKSFADEISKLTKGEKLIYDKLKVKFPSATHVDVVDMSGGCGGMYNIVVCTPEFKGVRTVKQHQIVNEALKEELSGLHGWRIQTSHENNITDQDS